MRNRLYYVLIVMVLISGCGTTDLQEGIDVIRDKDKAEDVVDIDRGLDIELGLERHNEIREVVFDNKPLFWSDDLAKDAQSYADTLAQSGEFEHDVKNESNEYGENLYAVVNSNGEIPTFEEAVDNWYVEEQFYRYSDNSCSVDADNTQTVGLTTYHTCGHYTQIVWKDTSLIGCAKAKYIMGDLKDGYVIVCKYSTPGNIIFNGTAQKPY
jgi:pathogenesis-related protein 1